MEKNSLNEILKNIDLENLSSDNSFENLPDGYYLVEVEKVQLGESKTNNKMITWTTKVVENGISFNEYFEKQTIPNTRGRKVWLYSLLNNEQNVKRAFSDLLKFKDQENNSILDTKYFKSEESLEMSLGLLEGRRIYIHLSTSGDKNQWKRFVNWEAVEKIGL